MKMELLSPAGNQDALIAAVQNGADAVYLGGQVLNARRGAGNFDEDGLLEAVNYCHERGVRVYVTVNTMVKEKELPTLIALAEQIARAGADAAIVGELGVAKVLRESLPSLPLHASTQLAVHNAQGVQMLSRLGFERVVLARELRFEEIAECANQNIEIESFAHGALCVACSGQCLFSSLIGGRSGNRGLCAQPCRLPYTIEGTVKAEGYLLSPRDLCQLESLGALRDAGVASLKIEGRLRRPEYVAIVTRIYRAAIDALERGEAFDSTSAMDELRQIFNRGNFTRGYGPGAIDADLLYEKQPNHLGVIVGTSDGYGVRLSRDIQWTDGLVLRRVGEDDRPVKAEGSAGEIVLKKETLQKSDELIRMHDDAQLKAARETLNGEHRLVPIEGSIALEIGKPAELRITDRKSEIIAYGESVVPAQSRAIDADRVETQLRKTGDTPYRFDALSIDVDENAFIAVSALNELRRAALMALREKRITQRRGCARNLLPMSRTDRRSSDNVKKIALSVQSSDVRKLLLAAEHNADELCFAPNDVTEAALEKTITQAGSLRFTVALPMTLSGEDLAAVHRWTLRHKDRITGVLASNLSHFALDWPCPVKADFPMNAANTQTVDQLFALGAGSYTPSIELTASEIRELQGPKELIVYGRLPLMQLRHCPVSARCGRRPHATCDRCDHVPTSDRLHEHTLIDRKNIRFPLTRLKTSNGCIIQLLNSVPLMLLRHRTKLPAANGWRILLTDEPDGLAQAIIRLHQLAIAGKDPRDASEWALVDTMPSTTGHYFRGVE